MTLQEARIEAMQVKIPDHAHYSRLFAKLSKREAFNCSLFIVDNNDLSVGDFELAVNRWFVGRNDRSKNWSLMTELVSVANKLGTQLSESPVFSKAE